MRINLRPIQHPGTKLWGYKDKSGNLILDYQYDDAKSFNDEGFARVRVGDEWFFIDENGREYTNKEVKNIIIKNTTIIKL